MENFTPVASFIGGTMIGLAAISLLFFTGRIGGISGIFGGLLSAKHGDTAWRVLFIAGLLSGGILMLLFHPQSLEFEINKSILAVAVAGLLVGIGARLGSGCTSGHGVCGIGRLAPRSLVASGVFMATGAITAIIVNHVFGGVV